MKFEEAMAAMRNGKTAKRAAFRDTCYVRIQYPDAFFSTPTLPYLAMVKGESVFPLDLSCESLFAEDWIVN